MKINHSAKRRSFHSAKTAVVIVILVNLAGAPAHGAGEEKTAERTAANVNTETSSQKPDLTLRGWLRPPDKLTQRNRDGSEIKKGAVSKADAVNIYAHTSSCSLNRCGWEYTLEVEIRPMVEEFTDNPTHQSPALVRTMSDCSEISYPAVNVGGLSADTSYKWRAREKVVTYEEHHDDGKLRCINPAVHFSGWASHGGETLYSFMTPPLITTVTAFPDSVVMETGTLENGNASRLVLDDYIFYRVWSTNLPPHVTSWYGVFTGLTPRLSNLQIDYKGGNSRECEQSLSIWNWKEEDWIELDSRPVGEEDVEIDGLHPPDPSSAYVAPSGNGELRVRIRCVRENLTFTSNGNRLRIVYDKPLSVQEVEAK